MRDEVLARGIFYPVREADLPHLGVLEADLVTGLDTITRPVQVLMVNGFPKKVIGLATASIGETQILCKW